MHLPSRSGVARAALLITVGGLASRLLGLVREQLAAGYFGAGDDVAAFQIADNVQTLLFDLVISGMLQAALIPVLVDVAGESRREDLRRIAGTVVTVAFLIVGLATIGGWLFTDHLVELMTSLGAGDQSRSSETVALTEQMIRIALPGVLFLAIGTVFSAVLYSLGRAAGPATALAARNLVVVVAILGLADRLGVKSMAYGVLGGGVFVAAIQVPWLISQRALPRPNLHLRDPAVRQIGRLYLPVFLGLIISTVQVVVDRNLAWRAEADALGAMRYATTLVQSVLGLVAAAISLCSPLISPTAMRTHSRVRWFRHCGW
jgi:putative peptidoglycan lipid II flippase